MRKSIITTFVIGSFFIGGINTVFAASEINYGSIQETKGDTVLVSFRNPKTTLYYTCLLEGECKTLTKEPKTLFPSINGLTNYLKSPNGTYAIVETPVPVLSIVNYVLYRIDEDDAEFVTLLPFNRTASLIQFSRDEERIIFREANGNVTSYDIDNNSIHSISTGVTSFPYWSMSPDGTHIARYNYNQRSYTVWNIETGTSINIPDAREGVLEFSTGGDFGAFTSTKDGFTTLILVDLRRGTQEASMVTSDETVVDYIFAGDLLFYASNSKASPYEWTLYKYNPDTHSKEKVAEDFSYGEYMKVREDNLMFIQMKDSKALPAVYNTSTRNLTLLDPLKETRTFEKITRKVVHEDGIHAVVWQPTSKKSETLLVWLHGGPQRQTSHGYHPYFSYGVYDDILKRFVDKGVTVVRIDYTGSFGYGEDFIQALNANLGKRDVEDVMNIVDEVRTSRMNNVYLIGNSYGGYLALRTLVEEPQAFVGAISINGVTDWQSLIARIPSSPFASYFGGIPHIGNQVLYDEASVVNRLSSVKDKEILMVYGKRDSTVPTWQTTEFAATLESQNIDSKLISFDDEEHVIVNDESLETLCSEISRFIDVKASCSF